MGCTQRYPCHQQHTAYLWSAAGMVAAADEAGLEIGVEVTGAPLLAGDTNDVIAADDGRDDVMCENDDATAVLDIPWRRLPSLHGVKDAKRYMAHRHNHHHHHDRHRQE